MGRPLRNCCDLNCRFLAHSADKAEAQKEYVCGLSKVLVPGSAGPGVQGYCTVMLCRYDAGHWGCGDW